MPCTGRRIEWRGSAASEVGQVLGRMDTVLGVFGQICLKDEASRRWIVSMHAAQRDWQQVVLDTGSMKSSQAGWDGEVHSATEP